MSLILGEQQRKLHAEISEQRIKKWIDSPSKLQAGFELTQIPMRIFIGPLFVPGYMVTLISRSWKNVRKKTADMHTTGIIHVLLPHFLSSATALT